jgi:hypothetical protein
VLRRSRRATLLAVRGPGKPRPRRVRSRFAGFSLALLVALAIVGVRANMASATPTFQMPFPCGEAWYASTYTGHQPSEYSIDWNLSGTEDHNKPVQAGVSGTATVQSFQNPGYGNYVDVAITGETGWVTRYAHLESVSVTTGQAVTPQTQIGTVGASGLSGTPPPYHLHYEQRLNGVVQAAVFDGSAITYAYSLPGNSYTSNNCGDTTGRIGALDSSNVLWVKEGAVGAQWQQQATGVSEFHLSSNRIGIVQNGTLSVKEGGLGNGWSQQATSVSTFRLTNSRLGILQGGTFSVKEGVLTNGWSGQATNVSNIDVSPNRLGILQSGTLAVKEGVLTNGWATLASGVSAFRVIDTRVGILQSGTFSVKEGGLGNGWSQQATGVSSMDVSSNRIGVLQSGAFSVKEGGLGNGWSQIATGAAGIRVIDTRVGVFQSSTFSVKEGGLTNGWTPELNNCIAADLS